MPRSIETENITVAMPVDLLDLLDDLCIRKDLHRTQTVVRAIKAYLALDAVSDCSLLTMAAGAWQDGPAPKDGSWILGLFYGLPYVVCYDSWEISEEGGPKRQKKGGA